jgi:hypothetical protein
MEAKSSAKEARLFVGGFFVLFLLLNVVLVTCAAIGQIANKKSVELLPVDSSPALRLLIFGIGLAMSWLVGQWLYKLLIKGEIPVSESVSTAFVFAFYLILTFMGVAFFGVLSWLWLAILLLILLVVSLFALWRVVGIWFVLGAIVISIVAAWLTFYLLG